MLQTNRTGRFPAPNQKSNRKKWSVSMQIGARQGCIAGGDSIEEKLGILRSLGLDFLELALSREEIENLDATSADDYRGMIERSGLPILSTSMGHFGRFAAKSAEERAEIIEHIRSLIPFTKAIGADSILLATSEEESDVADYAPVYRKELQGVADEAAEAGVTFAMEHVGWYKPYVLAQLVKAIDHPAVGIYFDMGNCLYVGEDPLTQARACAPYTAQLHVKGGPTTPLAAMPLVGVREILQNAGFLGRACFEIPAMKGDRHLAEARALLKAAGY